MKKEIDIYDYSKWVEGAVRLVERAPISEKNKKLILEFRDFCSLNGIGMPRMIRYLGVLKDWAILLEIDFDKATKEDIMKSVRIVQENENYAAWTKATYKIMLKRFYKWLKNSGDDHPEEVKWIKTNIKRTEKMLPANGDLITEKEVKKLVGTAEHPRDKAFVSLLYESGARIGELASLQIKDVKFDEYGAILHVTGKTGPRPIRIIFSTPHLIAWLQSHPLKEDKNAPLWINIGTTRHNSAMKYSAVRQLLRKLFLKAGIKKRFNPHMFRHSRATFLADHLTEFQMNQYFGWIQGSAMPATYVHMSGKKIDASILALNGIKNNAENSRESELKPKICPRCDMINSYDAKFCSKCAGILDVKTAYELEAKTRKEQEMRKSSDELIHMLMKDPEFTNIFVNKIKELGLAEKIVGTG